MRTSTKGIDLIKSFEGLRLKAYRDQGGVLTVGYGFTGPEVKPDTVWTQEQADIALQTRIDAVDSILTKCIIPTLTQNQWDAVVSLAYNIGQGAFRGSTLLRLINQRQYAQAAGEFPKWDHIHGVVVAGLLKRRQAEQTLFLS